MSDRKFVTRGALMQCNKGSHCRRLNLINGHGFEMCIEGRTGESGESMNENGKRHPFLLDTDTVVATEEMPGTEQQNISWFGVCTEAAYEGENICLQPDTSRGTPKNNETVHGTKCQPLIQGKWENTKEDIEFITANGSGTLLTTDSYLICDACGGIISFVEEDEETSNGTEYWDEQDEGR